MKLKVCGMRSTRNITAVDQLGADYMGFIFYDKSKRFVGNKVTPEQLKELKTNKVAVFVNEEREKVERILREFDIKIVQLHGDENPEYCNKLMDKGYTVIKAFGLHEEFEFTWLEDYLFSCDYFLFDTKGKEYGGNGISFNWEILKKYEYDKAYFLSGGIGIDEVEDIRKLNDKRIHAIDINSKFEIEPGLKDVEMVKEFMGNLLTPIS